ncbi:oocyte-secreted protein 3-like isoform X2 [Cavia porcellus]|uniref:oocyte-secreted protein 3-like isoform X2 n=1 Tax=Cavia porcellus TaxID=10141 RepID=UPI002FE2E836
MSSMMKSLLRLGGSLLLLLSFMWICSGQEQAVSVQCTRFNFQAVVKRRLLRANEFVEPEELSLGKDCPATLVLPEEIHFSYPVSLCGISMLMYMYTLTFYSWLNYKPRNGLNPTVIPLECSLSSDPTSPEGPKVHTPLVRKTEQQEPIVAKQIYCHKCHEFHLELNMA